MENRKEFLNDPHWINLPYPLRPNPAEVEIFRENLLPGKTLLLGSTKDLLPLCDVAVDLDPKYEDSKLIYGDWYNISGDYENIIADGSLNWGAEELLPIIEKHCKRFICRVFSEKLPGMKYATHFYSEFEGAEKIAEINKLCPIFIWKFTGE